MRGVHRSLLFFLLAVARFAEAAPIETGKVFELLKKGAGLSAAEAAKLEDIPHDAEVPEYGRVLLPVELPAKAVKISGARVE